MPGSRSPTPSATWIDDVVVSLAEEGAIGAGAIDLSLLLPVVTGATSLIGLDLRLPDHAGLGGLPAQGPGRP